ncbi:MAG: VWA domain-containing protein [Gammaproteobacteria bacterium]
MHIRRYLQSDETLRQRGKWRCVLFLGIALSGIATPAAAQIDTSTPVTLLQDIALVLDNSGSMKKNDPRFLGKEAVARFVEGVPDDARLSVVIFDKQVRATPLGSRDSVNLAQFNYRGPLTNIPAAVARAIQELKLNGRPRAARSILLLTDGAVDTGARSHDRELTRRLREQLAWDADDSGIKIFTIALSAGSDIKLLQELAKRTGGGYFHAPQAKDLLGIFVQISHAFFAPAVSQAPSKRVPQVSPRTPVADPAPSNLPQAEPPKAGGDKASTLPGNAPPREPEPRAEHKHYGFWLIDQNSKNGTYVNGNRVNGSRMPYPRGPGTLSRVSFRVLPGGNELGRWDCGDRYDFCPGLKRPRALGGPRRDGTG